MLEQNGYRAITAGNGADGLVAYSQNLDIQVVITDLIMPEQEGMETIRLLKKEFPQTRIIAISGGGRIGPEAYLPARQVAEGIPPNGELPVSLAIDADGVAAAGYRLYIFYP